MLVSVHITKVVLNMKHENHVERGTEFGFAQILQIFIHILFFLADFVYLEILVKSMENYKMDNLAPDWMEETATVFNITDDNTSSKSDETNLWFMTKEMLILPIFIIFILTGVFGNCLVCLAIYSNR